MDNLTNGYKSGGASIKSHRCGKAALQNPHKKQNPQDS